MLRLTNNFQALRIAKEVINTDSYLINSQIIRWRKPRWIPKAKSKIFKVPPRTIIPEDEKLELQRLNNNYKTQAKSIRKYLITKYNEVGLSQIADQQEEHDNTFEEDYTRCVALNNEWNEQQKVLREKRVAEELEVELDLARKRIEEELIKEEQKFEFMEELVRKEKEQSKTFITAENIDVAIDRALASHEDYNYAITLDGEKIIGFEKQKSEEKKEISQ